MSDHQKTYFEYDNSIDSLPNGIPNKSINLNMSNPGFKIKTENEGFSSQSENVPIRMSSDIDINEDSINFTRNNATKINKNENHIPFWSEDPNILLKQDHVLEFYPSENMSYEQKLNAITRLVIVITIFSYYVTRNSRFIFIGLITLLFIYILYNYKTNENSKKKKINNIEETFDNSGIGKLKKIMHKQTVFQPPNSENPLGNVLNTDIEFHPLRKPAPPAFNENINAQIMEQAKQVVRNANPDQPDITDKLFKDLGDQYTFEQSLRPFYSNPATTIPNDQGAFSDFCYGTMISCKEENNDACMRNQGRYTNY